MQIFAQNYTHTHAHTLTGTHRNTLTQAQSCKFEVQHIAPGNVLTTSRSSMPTATPPAHSLDGCGGV